ncbi:ribokinase [Maritalea sp. S77]|jgi:ribokinase|uniref:ribokinase n=1 Tax=Maritalea sp. S77 TaxID=3415125 RepID=UPI003C7ADD59
MLSVFGSINVDQVIRVHQTARPGQTIKGELEAVTFGGKGANQAVAAARVAGASLPILMIGAVGNDEYAEDVLRNFADNSVDASGVSQHEGTSGVAMISLDSEGENAITLIGGANDLVRADALADGVLTNSDIFLCQGEIAFEETAAAIERFRDANKAGQVMLNLAPVPQIQSEQLEAVLEQIQFLVVNEHEAKELQDIMDLNEEVGTLAQRFDLTLILTLGPDGAKCFLPNGEMIGAASPKINVVDTTGAGDTFVGALAALLAQKTDLKVALHKACKAGGVACTRLGAQTGMPTLVELETIN